jgi:hypothetical protein
MTSWMRRSRQYNPCLLNQVPKQRSIEHIIGWDLGSGDFSVEWWMRDPQWSQDMLNRLARRRVDALQFNMIAVQHRPVVCSTAYDSKAWTVLS